MSLTAVPYTVVLTYHSRSFEASVASFQLSISSSACMLACMRVL